MATSIQATHNHHDHGEGHGLDYPTRVTRARAGVVLLIMSDASFVLAILASHVYLRALNTTGQFHPKDELPPSLLGGAIITAITILSAIAFYWGVRQLQKHREGRGLRTGVLVAWVLTLVALAGQVWLLLTLRYALPLHAYGSIMLLLTIYHTFHLVLTALIGALVLGRISRGRIVGHEYAVEGAGYWWYYVAGAALLVWLATSLIS